MPTLKKGFWKLDVGWRVAPFRVMPDVGWEVRSLQETSLDGWEFRLECSSQPKWKMASVCWVGVEDPEDQRLVLCFVLVEEDGGREVEKRLHLCLVDKKNHPDLTSEE